MDIFLPRVCLYYANMLYEVSRGKIILFILFYHLILQETCFFSTDHLLGPIFHGAGFQECRFIHTSFIQKGFEVRMSHFLIHTNNTLSTHKMQGTVGNYVNKISVKQGP